MFLKYLRAAASIFRTHVLKKDRVTPAQYRRRIETCYKCPALSRRNTSHPVCGACGCLMFQKALDRTEVCPIDREDWRV